MVLAGSEERGSFVTIFQSVLSVWVHGWPRPGRRDLGIRTNPLWLPPETGFFFFFFFFFFFLVNWALKLNYLSSSSSSSWLIGR